MTRLVTAAPCDPTPNQEGSPDVHAADETTQPYQNNA